MSDLGASSSITIDAPVETVWTALTTPELIKTWFFGVDTETDWEAGSSIVHRGEWQGKPYEDRGEILKIDPPTLLVHTHWGDTPGPPAPPENSQRVPGALDQAGPKTKLTVTERNLPSEEAKTVSEDGWKAALTGLKG